MFYLHISENFLLMNTFNNFKILFGYSPIGVFCVILIVFNNISKFSYFRRALQGLGMPRNILKMRLKQTTRASKELARNSQKHPKKISWYRPINTLISSGTPLLYTATLLSVVTVLRRPKCPSSSMPLRPSSKRLHHL